MVIVAVERAGELIILTNQSGEILRRTLTGNDMISSTEHNDGTAWKKVEAVYFDLATTTIKVVYKA